MIAAHFIFLSSAYKRLAMKKIIIVVYLINVFLFVSAQTDTTLYGYIDSSTFKEAEIKPVFPGGPGAWKRYLENNLYHSQDPIPKMIENIVTVQFIVELNSKTSEIKVVKSVNRSKDKKAINLIKDVPWMPALNNGQSVRYRMRIDIQFPPDAP